MDEVFSTLRMESICESSKAILYYKGKDKYDDKEFLSYLNLIDASIQFSMKNDCSQNIQLKNLIIELQEMLFKSEQSNVSKNIIALATQIFLKSVAEYFLMSKNNDAYTCFVPILSSLSFQLADFSSMVDSDLAARSARMALDSLTLFLCTYNITAEQSWNDSKLAELIVAGTLTKYDENRLQSSLFTRCRSKCTTLIPTIRGKYSELLAKTIKPHLKDEKVLKTLVLALRRTAQINLNTPFHMSSFIYSFVKNLDWSPEESTFASTDWKSFSAIDFSVFLQWLTQWSILSKKTVKTIHQLKFNKEHDVFWKAIVSLITSNCDISLEDTLKVSALLKIIRLVGDYRAVKVLYGVFTFAVNENLPHVWPEAYAKVILRVMTEYIENPREHLFRIVGCEQPTVDEEDEIEQSVREYLSSEKRQNLVNATPISVCDSIVTFPSNEKTEVETLDSTYGSVISHFSPKQVVNRECQTSPLQMRQTSLRTGIDFYMDMMRKKDFNEKCHREVITLTGMFECREHGNVDNISRVKGNLLRMIEQIEGWKKELNATYATNF